MGNRSHTQKRYHGENHWRHLRIKRRQRDRRLAFVKDCYPESYALVARSYQQKRDDRLAR